MPHVIEQPWFTYARQFHPRLPRWIPQVCIRLEAIVPNGWERVCLWYDNRSFVCVPRWLALYALIELRGLDLVHGAVSWLYAHGVLLPRDRSNLFPYHHELRLASPLNWTWRAAR